MLYRRTQTRKAISPKRMVALRYVVSAAPPVEEETALALPVALLDDLVVDADADVVLPLPLPYPVVVALLWVPVLLLDEIPELVTLFVMMKLAQVIRVLFA